MRSYAVRMIVSASLLFMLPIGYQLTSLNSVFSSLSNGNRPPNMLWVSIGWPIGAVLTTATPTFRAGISRHRLLFGAVNGLLVVGGLAAAVPIVWTVAVGRLLCGCGAGLAMTVLPVYLLEISDRRYLPLITASIVFGFWSGAAVGSALGLESVLGGLPFWPVYAVVPAFLAAMTVVLSPLFPESPVHYLLTDGHRRERFQQQVLELTDGEPRSAFARMRDFETQLADGAEWTWPWRTVAGCVLTGVSAASTGLTPMFAYARPTLTLVLRYRPETSGRIEACTAGVYAAAAVLGVLAPDFRRKRRLFLTTCGLNALCMLVSATLALLTEFSLLPLTAGKTAFVASFAVGVCVHQTLFSQSLARMLHVDNFRHWMHRSAFANLGFWTSFLVWTCSFGDLYDTVGGWTLVILAAFSLASGCFAERLFHLDRRNNDDNDEQRSGDELTPLLAAKRPSSTGFGLFAESAF